MMNILVISHSSVVGSYQGKLDVLARSGKATVDLIVPPRWIEGGRNVDAMSDWYSSFRTHIVPASRLNRVASYYYHPSKLRQVFSKVNPSVIYAEEEPWSVASWQALRLARKANIPFFFFTWENVWKSYKIISQSILMNVLSHSAGAVAGNMEAGLLLQRRGYTKPTIILPQYGVSTDFPQTKTESPATAESRKPLLVYIGRLEHEKGVSVLLDAFGKISAQSSLLIVGNGSAKAELVARAERMKLTDRIRFIDAVPHSEISSYLSIADILVLPSLTTPSWKEQFGRVLIEAMVCGAAVIGSNSGAITEVIGDAGIVFREGNSDDLAERISVLLRNSSLRAEYIRKGKERAITHFSDSSIAERLYNFLSSSVTRK